MNLNLFNGQVIKIYKGIINIIEFSQGGKLNVFTRIKRSEKN